ncbi:MAG: cell division protein ZapA (FtsZ GTPase activity inhibitor) [Saprospiraceae bacterium]
MNENPVINGIYFHFYSKAVLVVFDMDDDSKQISVLIAGKSYPLKVKMKDEKSIRLIIKEVNEKIDEFQVNYPRREQKDCMAMSLLSYAVDLHEIRQNPTPYIKQEQVKMSKKLSEIDVLLDDLLQE